MPAKDPLVDSAAPEVVVDVTKKSGVRAALLVCSGLLLLFSYQNCSVELSSTTPGAALSSDGVGGGVVCMPTDAQKTALKAVMNSTLTAATTTSGLSGCVTCHVEGGLGGGKYAIINSQTDNDLRINFCTIKTVGSKIYTYPQPGNSHPGGDYPASDLTDLQNFAMQNF
jgi:hypothetical protein